MKDIVLDSNSLPLEVLYYKFIQIQVQILAPSFISSVVCWVSSVCLSISIPPFIVLFPAWGGQLMDLPANLAISIHLNLANERYRQEIR